ncbi:hypothetical protein [Umezawaea sp.]|uniref:hypothetical protein n=1 Tax=Umezawaea sp. TaxID=1955258 RepID=UPI002ED4765D
MTSYFPSGRPLFSLLEDTSVSADGHGLTVHGRWGDIDVSDDSPLVREALNRMSLGPVSLENIPVLFAEFDRWRTGGCAGTEWSRLKLTLDELGGVVVPSLGLHDGAGPILSLVAVVSDAVFPWPRIEEDDPIEVAREARIEDVDGDQVLVCPGPPYVVVLHRPPAPGIAKQLLDGRTTVTEVAGRLQVDRSTVADVVAYLASAGFILSVDPGKSGRTPSRHH